MLWIAGDNFYRHRAHVRCRQDLSYGDHEKQRLDLFLPLEAPGTALVAFVHGGAWKIRDRRFHRWMTGLYSNVGAALARRGIAAAVLGYRQLTDDVRPSIDDLRRALDFLAEHAPGAGAPAGKLVLMGHSAGAHLAGWLALDPDRRGQAKGWIALAGFYDVARFAAALPRLPRRHVHRLFGPDLAAASPERWVDASAPPLLAGAAARDAPSITDEQGYLAAAYRRAGAAAQTFEVSSGHMGLVLQMGREADTVSDRLAGWIARL